MYTHELAIPHIDMQHRDFVLAPMAEIALIMGTPVLPQVYPAVEGAGGHLELMSQRWIAAGPWAGERLLFSIRRICTASVP